MSGHQRDSGDGMSQAELDHLNVLAAQFGARVEVDGEAYTVVSRTEGRTPVSSMAMAGVLIGGLIAVSAEFGAAAAVASARYGLLDMDAHDRRVMGAKKKGK
jgi:hypothetical protein